VGLKPCRECGHPVASGDAVCSNCGAALGQRGRLFWVGGALLGLGLSILIFFAMFQPGRVPRRAETRLSPLEALQQKADQILADGVVTKADGRSVWIEAALWRLHTEEERVDIARSFGTLAGLKDGSNRAACEIRDNRTGKVVASWSEATGLTIVQK
jgi:hypothetical protein